MNKIFQNGKAEAENIKICVKIVSACVVSVFYKEHLFYLFVAVFFAFGILKPSDHIALNQYIIASDGLIAAYLVVWTLYNAYVIFCFLKSLREPRHHFMLDLYLFSPLTRFLSLLESHTVLLSPALVYGVYVLIIAISMKAWVSAILVVLFFSLSIIYPVIIYTFVLKKPDTGFAFSFFSGLDKYYKKPRFSFFLFHLLHNRQAMFILSKLFSCVLLVGGILIFATGNEGSRPLLLAALLAVMANMMPIYYFHRFENIELLNFKNLPFTRLQLWLNAALVIVLLMIPEFILLARYFPAPFSFLNYVECCFFMVSIPVITYHYLFIKYIDSERFSHKLYWIFGFYFICILFYLPGWLMAGLAIFLSAILMNRFYYQYQFIEDKTG